MKFVCLVFVLFCLFCVFCFVLFFVVLFFCFSLFLVFFSKNHHFATGLRDRVEFFSSLGSEVFFFLLLRLVKFCFVLFCFVVFFKKLHVPPPSNIKWCSPNPCPSKVFFVTRLPNGGDYYPLPRFRYKDSNSYDFGTGGYRYGPPLSIDTKKYQ